MRRFGAGLLLAALAALVICGCFTKEAFRSEVQDTPDSFNSLLDSMINDRRTWVNPPDGF